MDPIAGTYQHMPRASDQLWAEVRQLRAAAAEALALLRGDLAAHAARPTLGRTRCMPGSGPCGGWRRL